MNPLKSALMIVALILVASLVLAQDRSQAQQFQEAITMMETKGNYTAAIRLFEQAAKGPDRTLAARALYYAGQCYEKSGKDKAQQAYQRVIKQFAEQRQVVAEARARLSALSPAAGNVAASKAASGPTVRQVLGWPDARNLDQAVSPDGRYLSGEDRETLHLTIRDLSTGEKRRLTNKLSNKGEWYGSSIFSPDSKHIAYTLGIKKDKKNSYELRIVGIDGSGERVLYRKDDIWYLTLFGWSPDGKHILSNLNEGPNNNKDNMVLISVADGSTRILKSLSYEKLPSGFHRMYFSPDGRYIAYSYFPRNDSDQRDISIISTSDGSRDVPLVQSPADDQLLGWAPDGKSILFISDRSKTIDAWIIPVADGKPQGAPELVKRDLGRKIWPMGFTRSGSFYYSLGEEQTNDIYIATLAPETGKLIGSPMLAKTRFTGSNGGSDWSPDGRYLVYISSGGMNAGGPSGVSQIFILNPETGEEREVRSKLKRHNSPVWFPDGKSLLVRDWTDPQGSISAGLFKIDSETGETTLLVPEKPGSELGQPRLSHDGKAIFYQNKNTLWKRNLETGEVKEIYRPTPPTESIGFTQSLAVSPDGQRLAFLLRQSLFVIPATGGDARELLKLGEPEAFAPDWSNVAWTPDGRYLVFAKSGDKQSELWRIPAGGGEPQKLGQLLGRVSGLRVHPDGQRIAFGVRQWNKGGVWVMENFLPVAQPRKTAMSRR
jgi:Tol biopolymer transport system component